MFILAFSSRWDIFFGQSSRKGTFFFGTCIDIKSFFYSSLIGLIYGKHTHYVLIYYKDYYFLLLLEANVVFIVFNFFPFNYSVYLIKHGTTMIDCKVFSIRYATLYWKYYFHAKNYS